MYKHVLIVLLVPAAVHAHYTINPEKIPGALRIMTFNVRGLTSADQEEFAWKNRIEPIVHMIKDFDPDIIGFQEPKGLEVITLAEKLGNPYKWFGKSRGMNCSKDDNVFALGVCEALEKVCHFFGFESFCYGDYNPIFYKKTMFKRKSHGTFWLNENMKKEKVGWDASDLRICTWATFQMKDSQRQLTIANTHLDHKGALARKNGLQLIADFLHNKTQFNVPTIIMGDFNASMNIFAETIAQYQLQDARSVAKHKVGPQDGTFTNYGSNALGTIDHIVLSPLFKETAFKEVVQYGVIEREDGFLLSDHRPVFIDVIV